MNRYESDWKSGNSSWTCSKSGSIHNRFLWLDDSCDNLCCILCFIIQPFSEDCRHCGCHTYSDSNSRSDVGFLGYQVQQRVQIMDKCSASNFFSWVSGGKEGQTWLKNTLSFDPYHNRLCPIAQAPFNPWLLPPVTLFSSFLHPIFSLHWCCFSELINKGNAQFSNSVKCKLNALQWHLRKTEERTKKRIFLGG